MCGVLGHLAPVHLCPRSVRCVVCAVSWATWLLFNGVVAPCVVLRVWCPGPLGSCSPVCSLGGWCGVCGVVGHLAPVHRCARSVRCVACVVSWGTWPLFTGVLARHVVLPVGRPGLLGASSPLCSLGALSGVCGVRGQLAPVHLCPRSVRCAVCAVSWATWLLFTGVLSRRVVSRVRCRGPFGSYSPVCSLRALCCVCGVLGDLAPVHRCAPSACCVACAASWVTWRQFTAVLARCAVWRVWCPSSWLLFTCVLAPCVVMCVRCPGPLGSCSPVCSLRALCCVCGILGHLSPVHRCVRSVGCVACAVSWATWLLFTSLLALCVVLRVWRPGPLGTCSPVYSLGVLCCVCGVRRHLAPVHRCARSASCVACVVT